MRAFFIILTLVLSYAAISGGALAWDGGYYLFRLLDAQSPVFVQYRYSVIPLHYVVLLLSKLTENFALLPLAFSVVYAVIPLASLFFSWWVLDRQSKHLFLWPVLGICLGTLPGQMFFVSEAMIAVQLFWPVLLLQIRRVPGGSALAMALLSLVVFFTHPVSAVLFGLSVVVCLVAGTRSPEVKLRMWLCAFLYASAAGLRILMIKSSYETTELSTLVLRQHFESGLRGAPLVFLCVAWLSGFALLKGHLDQLGSRRRSSIVWYFIASVAIVVSGFILVPWALNPAEWKQALNYRSFVLIGSIPFMVFAGIDGFISRPEASGISAPAGGRLSALYMAGTVYALIIVIQCTIWSGLTSRLARELSVGKKTLAVSSLTWTRQTPLYHWSTPALAVILQGRVVHALLLDDRNSRWLTSFDGDFNELFGYKRSRSHWLQFPSIGHLTTTVERVDLSGWHYPERVEGEKVCWNNGRGMLRIQVDTAVDAILDARVATSSSPNELNVSVNGLLYKKLPVICAPWEFCDMEPVCLRLAKGENLVEFHSTNATIPVGGDGRRRAMAFKNLRLQFAFEDTLEVFP